MDVQYDEDYSLSGYDIFDIIGYEVGVILESKIHSEADLYASMHNNALLILINDQEPIHHWTSLTLDGQSIVYFDPFGETPKNPYIRKITDRYMNHQLQNIKASTCGRWVAHFIRFYCINEDAYAALFRNNKGTGLIRYPDGYITKVTGDIWYFNTN